ncbi:hypothetical protein [Salipaludibacillus aurantiacus]|uniref:Cellobiose phosphorylase n=1 Tax=Salipaludibacillus aurantiacus TaxID=1601833 RepID=A0A1H9V342_9BACI|nr:hypothetical protein [Salipaludibacillus aurantiacus]SES15713.1 hypothetical protein SAMN05518684_10994 [Salipaludibacillus aurantiacus]
MYQLKEDHSFEITHYQNQPPFSSFLPGIAGESGIPMWVFYVNRGQGIASFGIQDKNHAMMEFLPADKSYQMVHLQGFRTFIKISDSEGERVIEPFQPGESEKTSVKETMTISENMLELEYVNHSEGFSMNVSYYTLAHSPVSGLIRHVTFRNNSDRPKTFEILDGMPALLPSGVANTPYKELGNTLKSWFDVVNLDQKVPFYKLRGSMEDTAEVSEVNEGNFYVSLFSTKEDERIIKPIVDRDVIFGADTSMQTPVNFIDAPLTKLTETEPHTTNKVSCGFTPVRFELKDGEEAALFTVIGHGRSLETVQSFVKSQISVDYLENQKRDALLITKELTKPIQSETGQPLFDAYSRQSYLDNGLRGGFPFVFKNKEESKVYYLYSRKHGDLERDYNFFSISPTFYSQGNGNYRDINQNRRCDVFFEPHVFDQNVRQFMSLIQLDGYNPLAVKGVRFKLEEFDFSGYVHNGQSDKLTSFFEKTFTPGELKHFITDENIELTVSFDEFLTTVLLKSDERYEAEFGEGFWVDHWTYNLDLIDSFLAVYPDYEEDFFFTRSYAFFQSPAMVQPRHHKYKKQGDQLRQYSAVAEGNFGDSDSNWVKSSYGSGEIYKTNLYSKLFLLGLVKASTLAPYGLGIEMEAGKPGWNDSLNGLPGMFGSSTSELMELYRLIEQLERVQSEQNVYLPEEASEFFKGLVSRLSQSKPGSESEECRYWHEVTALREAYREKVQNGISGKEVTLTVEEVKQALKVIKERVALGIERLKDYGELPPTYFYFNPEGEGAKEGRFDEVLWKPVPVTPFLEGVVKSLKVSPDKQEAKKIYNRVKDSAIYDRKLKMYKTSMPIKDEPIELGRAKMFTPGWLENESVFLHMEYKYLLEVLRSGLEEEFYEDIQSALIPFLDPAMYGRSTLENSSFIASSANPNPSLHGRGFVARLSGSTIEFMNMWMVMMAGQKPFTMAGGQLAFKLSPVLADWMFTEANEVTFTLLGQCKVTYTNPERKNTFGADGASPQSYVLTYTTGERIELGADDVTGEYAKAVRDGKVEKIAVRLR